MLEQLMEGGEDRRREKSNEKDVLGVRHGQPAAREVVKYLLLVMRCHHYYYFYILLRPGYSIRTEQASVVGVVFTVLAFSLLTPSS
jgi:hypothetical protein